MLFSEINPACPGNHANFGIPVAMWGSMQPDRDFPPGGERPGQEI